MHQSHAKVGPRGPSCARRLLPLAEKTRVLLIKEESLERLRQVGIESVEFSSNGRHHRQRFQHLQILAELWEAESLARRSSDSSGKRPKGTVLAAPGLCCGRVQLAIPKAWLT